MIVVTALNLVKQLECRGVTLYFQSPHSLHPEHILMKY